MFKMAYPYFNATNFTGFFSYMNDITSFWFGNFMVIIIFFVLFIGMKNYTTERAFGAAAFITLLFSFFLWGAHLVNFVTVLYCVVISAIALVNLIITKPTYGA